MSIRYTDLNYETVSYLRNIFPHEGDNVDNVDLFLTFMFEQGYFKIVSWHLEESTAIISVPNLEIEAALRKKLSEYFRSTHKLDFALINSLTERFDELCSTNSKNIEEKLKKILYLLNQIIEPVDLDSWNEPTLHHLIFIMVYHCTKFRCFSEVRSLEEDLNRLDILLLQCKSGSKSDLPTGIIIEMKYNIEDGCDVALKQILSRDYANSFCHRKYNPENVVIENRIFLGINMSDKKEFSMSSLYNSENFSEKKLIHV